MTLNILSFSIMTLSLKGLYVTLICDTKFMIKDAQHNNTTHLLPCLYDELLYAECHILFIVMLIVIIAVLKLSALMLYDYCAF
jgi:hypothetical protein